MSVQPSRGLFGNVYHKKKVLITGNTGFKGSWLSLWLNSLGAEVYGLSVDIPSIPSNYEASRIAEIIDHSEMDVIDNSAVFKRINDIRPDFLFHLAAQPIVKKSFIDPHLTLNVNIMGTINVLEALRTVNNECTAIFITSDKCYDNVEWLWGYRETDALGGKDPYSASKAAAEIVIKTYAESYFCKNGSKVKVASGRAGNVIGGGDWADSRIIPDAYWAWVRNEELIIRYPKATRPWQHVLEPLSGYLRLGEMLRKDNALCGESFNFGPNSESNYSVEQLLEGISKYWPSMKWAIDTDVKYKEAKLLKLNCDKALYHLNWVPNIPYDFTIWMVAEWYKTFKELKEKSMFDYSLSQILEYERHAFKRELSWTTL